MKKISKEEMKWLIANNYIKMEGGQYINFTTTGRKSKKKARYVPDNIYKHLSKMK